MSENSINKHPVSEDVYVFPFGSTRASKPGSRLLNEQNLTKIIRSLTDKANYVVEYKVKQENADITFVINGYLFTVEDIKNYVIVNSTGKTYLYAKITIHDDDQGLKYLVGSDNSGPLSGSGTDEDPYIISVSYPSSFRLNAESGLIHFQLNTAVESLTITSTEGIKVNEENSVVTEFTLSDNPDSFSLENTGSTFADVKFSPYGATDSVFTGLQLITTSDKISDNNALCLLEYNNGTELGVPRDSYVKNTSQSIKIGTIVCGDAVSGWHENS